MTLNEARRTLRRLELEAYAAIVSAFRAEGQLTLEKKASLTQLSQLLRYAIIRRYSGTSLNAKLTATPEQQPPLI
jgi:hypothetical protein